MSCDGMKKVLIWSQLSPSVTLFGDKSRHSIASNEVQFLHFFISSFNKADLYCLKVCLNYLAMETSENEDKHNWCFFFLSFISPTGLSFTDNLPAKNVLRIIDKRICMRRIFTLGFVCHCLTHQSLGKSRLIVKCKWKWWMSDQRIPIYCFLLGLLVLHRETTNNGGN